MPNEQADAEPVATSAVVDSSPEAIDQLPELPERKRWLIVAGGRVATDEKRPTIVVEHWSDAKVDPDGATDYANDTLVEGDEGGEVKASGYPTKATLYLRTSDAVQFGGDAPVFTLGREVVQGGFWGFSNRPGVVHVGPSHPAYAAANIAWQNGATDIEISGLSERQKGILQPFFDALPHREEGKADVKVTLS